mmetsp:Transcript_49505/g.165286  ORF Transcript_49505/g.165286 Transcript_49505/m.165286 type:complete len:138 (+) Transcript_49505:874-1287(+)
MGPWFDTGSTDVPHEVIVGAAERRLDRRGRDSGGEWRPAAERVAAVSAGTGGHCVAVTEDGRAWGWGRSEADGGDAPLGLVRREAGCREAHREPAPGEWAKRRSHRHLRQCAEPRVFGLEVASRESNGEKLELRFRA